MHRSADTLAQQRLALADDARPIKELRTETEALLEKKMAPGKTAKRSATAPTILTVLMQSHVGAMRERSRQ